MKKEIKLPKISESDDKGLVAEIYVSEGDQVQAEDAIVAVESDKATVDIPVEESGKVVEIKVSEGDEISAGELLLILETEENGKDSGGGADEDSAKSEDTKPEEEEKKEQEEEKKEQAETEDKSDSQASSSDKEEGAEDQDTKKSVGDKKAAAKTEEKEDDPGTSKQEEKAREETSPDRKKDTAGKKKPSVEEDDDGFRASPLVRELAREMDIDLSDVIEQKSGDDRNLTREDIYTYVKQRMQQVSSPEEAKDSLPDFSRWGDTERSSLSPVRREILEVTQRAWREIPHVTNHDEADITRLTEHLDNLDDEAGITLTAVMIKILAEAMSRFPRFNSSLDVNSRELIIKKYISVAVAVDTEQGLFMPVLRDAGEKSLTDIAEELRDLAGKARNQKLRREDMEGGNIALSNLGGIGGTSFTPVIFPPHVAILGMSRAARKARWSDDAFRPRMILPLSLSYDHRVIDGADASRFLGYIRKALENPLELMG